MTKMAFTVLVKDLKQAGIGIRVHGDSIYFAPQSPADADLVRRALAHKQELVAIIRSGVKLWPAEPNASGINEATNEE